MGGGVTVYRRRAAVAARVHLVVGRGLEMGRSRRRTQVRFLGFLLLRLPHHDVGMPTRKGADSRMPIAPGLWRWRCVGERGLQRQALVNERSSGRIRVCCIASGAGLGQREQRRQQGKVNEAPWPQKPERRGKRKGSRGAHGDLQATNEKGIALPPEDRCSQRTFRQWQTHFGRRRSGDGGFDGQSCGGAVKTVCGRR